MLYEKKFLIMYILNIKFNFLYLIFNGTVNWFEKKLKPYRKKDAIYMKKNYFLCEN